MKGHFYQNKSTWNFDLLGENSLDFDDFSFWYEGKSPGNWPPEPEKDFFGTIKLCFDPDSYYCFVKQKN
jgi:hypothetical protein